MILQTIQKIKNLPDIGPKLSNSLNNLPELKKDSNNILSVNDYTDCHVFEVAYIFLQRIFICLGENADTSQSMGHLPLRRMFFGTIYCVESVRIWSFFVRIFPHSD